MSEYKFVQWGRGTPVDYQRLGQMSSNEQYLKDIADSTPRGVLAWKIVDGHTYANPSGGVDAVYGLENITFDVEADRSVSFTFYSGAIKNSAANVQCRFGLTLDGTHYISLSSPYSANGVHMSPGSYTWISSQALSKGSHMAYPHFVSDNYPSNITIGLDSKCIFIIRDEGPFVSATP